MKIAPMLTLLHISDLHFGRAHARKLSDAILRTEDDVKPHAVVCSGDLVEWTEVTSAWHEVQAFLMRLVSPTFVVPGNHDIPRLDFINRLRAPFARYQRYVRHELEGMLEVPGAMIVGLK